MGDAPTTHVFMKAIIFVFVFLTLYTTLLALIPSEFYYSTGATGSTYDYSFLALEDIRRIRFLRSVNLTYNNNAEFDFTTDVNFKMRVWWLSGGIYFKHLMWELLWWKQWDNMQIENITASGFGQYYLTKEYLILRWSSEFNASILNPVQCNHIRTKVWVLDTNSSRNNIGEAWDDGALSISMGFGYDDMEAKITAMDIMGRLLLFQAPTVFGLTGDMATIINLILTIPFYAMVGVLIFLIVIAIVPF